MHARQVTIGKDCGWKHTPGRDDDGAGYLFKIIDLAITLIGFSSIVTALRRSKDRSWSIQEINGLVFLAIMAIGAIIFSLLPLALHHLQLIELQAYSIAGGVYSAFGVSVVLGLFIQGRRSGYPSRGPRIFNLFALLSVGVIVVVGLASAGLIPAGTIGVYLLGVIWMLILAFVQFVVFLSFVGFVDEDLEPDA